MRLPGMPRPPAVPPVLARRAALIARAKAVAPPVVACVQSRLRPDHLLQDATWDELAALVIVLAEAASPAAVREVAESPADDGRPDPDARERRLRQAHAQFNEHRKARRPVPPRLAALEAEYQRWRKQAQRAAEGAGRAAA
jgi:hypothetical protein